MSVASFLKAFTKPKRLVMFKSLALQLDLNKLVD